jgi:ATP-dependent DNA helicase PIF1
MSNVSLLSPEQQYAFDRFKSGENLFITGPGGTGKTKLISYFVNYASEQGTQIDVCAMTGCAALLLNCNAKTLHSWSGIRLCKGPRDKIIAGVLKNKYVMATWKKAKILVIDEVSMMSEKIMEICDDIGRAVRKINRPFGGIQLVFTGDFYQLPPVGTYGEPDTERFCFQSDRWDTIFKPENHIQLTTMFRQTDPLYIQILLQVRKGELSEENAEILKTRVKKQYNAAENGGCVLTKLYPVRARAEYINRIMYEKIEEKEYLYECIKKTNCSTYVESGAIIKPVDIMRCDRLTEREKETFIEQMVSNCPVAENIALKVGAAVMCIINLDMDAGICNGSQGIVIDFATPAARIASKGCDGVSKIVDYSGELCPVVRFSNGCTRLIQRHMWQNDDYPALCISQFPLCLAWALTIHKIQGATMSMAEMDLGNAIFEYGQTYVALSRIQTIEGLYLTAFHPQRIKANPSVMEFYKNIDKYVRAGLTGLSPSSLSPGFSQFSYNPSSVDDVQAVVGSVKKSISTPVVEDSKKAESSVKIIRL